MRPRDEPEMTPKRPRDDPATVPGNASSDGTSAPCPTSSARYSGPVQHGFKAWSWRPYLGNTMQLHCIAMYKHAFRMRCFLDRTVEGPDAPVVRACEE